MFVTGGTGFVGSEVIKRCVKAGHEVRCLARPVSITSALEELGVEIVRGDILSKPSLIKGMTGCDVVIHAAAAYSFWTANRDEYREVNVGGTRNVMESALQAGVFKVIHVSSVVVYGKPPISPVTEYTPFSRFHASEYARTKCEGEGIAWNLHRSKALPLVVVYPGAIIGPGDPKATGQYIQNLIHRRLPATILDNASFPFIHVSDVAEAITRAAAMPRNQGARYLLVSENLTFGQLNTMISEISDVPLPGVHLPDAVTFTLAGLLTGLSRFTGRPPGWGLSLDQVRTMKNTPLVDGSRAERELGLKYIPIRQAIADAIASYRHHR